MFKDCILCEEQKIHPLSSITMEYSMFKTWISQDHLHVSHVTNVSTNHIIRFINSCSSTVFAFPSLSTPTRSLPLFLRLDNLCIHEPALKAKGETVRSKPGAPDPPTHSPASAEVNMTNTRPCFTPLKGKESGTLGGLVELRNDWSPSEVTEDKEKFIQVELLRRPAVTLKVLRDSHL